MNDGPFVLKRLPNDNGEIGEVRITDERTGDYKDFPALDVISQDQWMLARDLLMFSKNVREVTE